MISSTTKPLKIVRGHATQNKAWPKSAKILTLILSILIVIISLVATAAIILAVTYATTLELYDAELANSSYSASNTTGAPGQSNDPYFHGDTYQFQECGIQKTEPILNKIINGYEAKPHSWPWMVVLGYFGMVNQTFVCGGSLIGSRWVLTAAHCVADNLLADFGLDNQNYTLTSMIRVFVGVHNLSTDIHHSNTYQADKIIRHPFYNSRRYSNDIALIKLSREVVKTENIEFLCIDPLVQINVGDLVYAAGWGSTNPDHDKENTPYTLYQVTFNVLDHFSCHTDYGYQEGKQFCAGRPSSNPEYVKDTCFGDSGGPIMVKRNNWVTVGVVSFGNIACDGNGIYTKVNYYYDWIMDNIFYS